MPVRLLLAAPGISIAACEGHEACMRLLLAAPGIYVNRPTTSHGQKPLYRAAFEGHDACIRLLLAAPGIDPWGNATFFAQRGRATRLASDCYLRHPVSMNCVDKSVAKVY